MNRINKITFTAITLLLLAGSANQALADTWTNIGIVSGTWPHDGWQNHQISYNGIINDNRSSWGHEVSNSFYWTGDYCVANVGPGTGNTVNIEIGIYKSTRTIPAYSKLVRVTKYQMALGSTRLYHGAGLYLFDDETTATSTALDATYYQNRTTDAGENYKIVKKFSTNTSSTNDNKVYEFSDEVSRSLSYDNNSGSNASDISKFVAIEHSTGNGNSGNVSGTDWASWTETSSTETWYYYKHVTFDANEGTGTAMAQLTIENSGNLTANTYTRLGYRFAGWNTQADGQGTSYSDGGAITATSEDKGPVTLYAQWEIDSSNAYTFIGGRCGSWTRSNDNRVSYDGIGANNNTSWGTYFGVQTTNHKSTDANTVKINNTNIAISICQTTRVIPSYSKLVRDVSFYISMASNRYDHGAGLYLFDDQNTAQSTVLDATYNQVRSDGNDYLIVKKFIQGQNGSGIRTYGSKSLIYNNCSASAQAAVSKYIAFEHSSGSGSTKLAGQENATWAEDSSTETWYYYKYVTFDANEGTGAAMAQLTIENSGNLTANTYTRAGYRFAGWNTQADGQGTSYSDGGAITATSEDKGPVTLYAQWGVDVAVSESESSITTFFEKNVVVPSGVEVYGFVYSDGALVQGVKISEGAILPANKGYLVKVTVAGTYTFVSTDAAATAPSSDLIGTTTEITTPAGNVYVWGKPEGYDYGWYKYTGSTIPAGKAYYIKQQ